MKTMFVGGIIHNCDWAILFNDCIRAFGDDNIHATYCFEFAIFFELFSVCKFLSNNKFNILNKTEI